MDSRSIIADDPHDGVQLRYVADDRVAILEDPDCLVCRLDHGHLGCLPLHRGGYVDVLFINALDPAHLPVFLDHVPVLAYPSPEGRPRDLVVVADVFVRAAAEVLLHQVYLEFF